MPPRLSVDIELYSFETACLKKPFILRGGVFEILGRVRFRSLRLLKSNKDRPSAVLVIDIKVFLPIEGVPVKPGT